MKSLKMSVLVVNKRHDDDEYGMINSGHCPPCIGERPRAETG